VTNLRSDLERASDEKQVDKLFHDITTGMLRRKRNGNWDDLSDSDDGGEARRRMKRRQFAKMQRALFTDERISKVAENPRNQAFLRTIEDHGSDDDMDFIFAPPPAPAGLESQDSTLSGRGQPTTTTIPDSQPQSSRPPAHLRRTKDGKRPSTISEIRESLSSLLDEPSTSSIIPATDPGSSDEDDDAARPQSSHSGTSNKENRNPRRTNSTTTIIIDRINLKRNSSSSSTTGALAFATASSTGGGGGPLIKVPALLRRATTNSSLLSTTSSTSTSTSTTHNPTTATSKIKKPAGKRSGVSYLARETERRAAVAEVERRREARKFKGMEGRGKAVGGLFGGGRFE
jgi:mediator of replication checkpoint protein 1